MLIICLLYTLFNRVTEVLRTSRPNQISIFMRVKFEQNLALNCIVPKALNTPFPKLLDTRSS